MVGILDFFSNESGQRRRAALDEFGRDIGYYVPPELRGLLGFVAEATPTASLERAGQASERMVAPDRTGMQRVGDLGAMLSETAGVAAPLLPGLLQQPELVSADDQELRDYLERYGQQ